MPNAGLSYGLNLKKKPAPGNRPQPAKRKPIFDEPDSDNDDGNEGGIEEIGEIGSVPNPSKPNPPPKAGGLAVKSSKNGTGPKKAPISMYGDLSSTFTSQKHASTAEELDPSIYDYDGVYDSLKPKKKAVVQEGDEGSKPKYMTNLMAAAAVRKRDATIAEEKKLAREREAEGEEFADKEKFVTSAYKAQQEENRRVEEEERQKEEAEQKKNAGKGMTNFYKNILEQGEQQHAEMMKAAAEAAKRGPAEKAEEEKEKSDAEIAREIGERTGQKIAVNDEGQVVDKTQLLKGGLNIKPKPKIAAPTSASKNGIPITDRSKAPGFVGAAGSKQAMRERQSRMMEAQLEQATKRAFEAEEEEREKVERASKSRKTEGEIMGAKERYLARKKEAEEAKKRGEAP